MKPLIRNWMLAFLVPRPLIGALFLPRYVRHWREFSAKAAGERPRLADSYPCLGDWTSTTPFDPHYFYQSAWLARRLAERRPAQHFDVGSSAQMVSVVSAITELTHIDYRPLKASLPGLRCMAGDILDLSLESGSVQSLSSLHVIEHIGLGRYGDPIDPAGSEKAAEQLARVVAPGGRLYVSVPVGRERICFNAHRVFAPQTIVRHFSDLKLEAFALVDDAGAFFPEAPLEKASGLDYGCGMFEFSRSKA